MDLIKQMRLEQNGVKNTILRYSRAGNIANFVEGYINALRKPDSESLKYFTGKMVEWYNHNIARIRSNSLLYNADDHIRNKELLEYFLKELDNYQFDTQESEKEDKSPNKILISHKSDDSKYGHAIRTLICGLGLRNDKLIYTSHHLHKIPLDKNIFDYLRDNIDSQIYILFLWSNKYLDSPACMSEMGAAWIMRSNYTNFFTPDFDYNNSRLQGCPVDIQQMGIRLDGGSACKASIIELKNKLCEKFDLSIDEQSWTDLLDKFIGEIKEPSP